MFSKKFLMCDVLATNLTLTGCCLCFPRFLSLEGENKLDSLFLSFFHQYFTLMSISLSFETEEALFTALRIYIRYAWPTSPFNVTTSPCLEFNEVRRFVNSSVASPKFWEPNILSLSEQQYLVWDTVSRSTRQQHVLDLGEIWESHDPFGPPGCAYVY